MIQSDDLKLKRAVQLLCTTGIRRPLTMERVKTWLKQFSAGPEQTLALLILRNLIYRTTDQIQSALAQALRKTALHFAANDDERKERNWREILTSTGNLDFLFGPPAHEYTKPGKSGELIVRLLKQSFAIDPGKIQYPSMVTQIEEDERYLIIDDGTFTGDQLTNLIASFDGVMKNPKRSGIVVSIAHERAIETLNRAFPDIPIFYGEKITHQDGLRVLSQEWISEGRWPYDGITPLEVYTNIVERKGEFETKQPLGFGSLGLLIAYEHGVPDDSLQLLWGRSTSWSPLFDR